MEDQLLRLAFLERENLDADEASDFGRRMRIGLTYRGSDSELTVV
jgi:hypothetical protein